jgi:hypothetical protein
MRRLALFAVGALLALPAFAAVSESEANDSSVSADALAPQSGGLQVDASLEAGDVDYFSLVLAEGDFLTATVIDDAGGALHDPILRLLDPNGAVAAEDDDSGPAFQPSLGLVVPAGAGGTWTIAVSAFGDADFDGTGHEEAFSYRLLVSTDPPGQIEALPDDNDTPATADSLGADFDAIAPGGVATVEGTLEPGGVDHFSFPVLPGRKLLAAIFETGGGAFSDPSLGVLASGVEVAADDDEGPGFLAQASEPVAGGATWTVVVRRFQSSDAEPIDYRLVIAQPADTAAPLFCDVNGDQFVDRDDVNAIFAARGTPASGPDDPRDADGDGTINVQDSRLCTLECANPNCAPPPSCGLLGVEPLGALAIAALVRRRTRRARERLEDARC